jgi:DNA-binding transcriptional LysR family regulator
MEQSAMKDLNDLHFFAAVVASGGFSAAARELGVPKSRLSRRVAELEDELGVRLLERSTRKFKVTDIGHSVYQHARAALSEAVAVDEVVTRLKAEPQGLVRVSCPLGVDRLLAAHLPMLLARYPRLRVQVVISNRRIDLVEEGIDVAIRVRERLDTDADLQVKIVGETGQWLVASPAFADKNGLPRTPADLARFPTISHTEHPGLDRWTLVNAAEEEVVVVHEPRLSASVFPILFQAAVEGMGIGMLPEFTCRQFIEEERLVRVLPEWSRPVGILHMVFTSRRGLLPSVRAVIDFLAEVLDLKSALWQTTMS